MRAALAITVAILIFDSCYGPVIAQTLVANVPAFESIHMMDALTGWAMTLRQVGGAVLRTTNGGTHWEDVTPRNSARENIPAFKIVALSSSIAWVIPAGALGATSTEVFHTTDGGQTWSHVTIPAPSVDAIHFTNSLDGWLLASLAAYMGIDEVEIYRSNDGGETWIKVASATHISESSGLPMGGGKNGVTFLNRVTGWITGATNGLDSMYLFVTHDGGRVWRQQQLPPPPQAGPRWEATTIPPTFFTSRDGVLPVSYSIFNNSHETGSIIVTYMTHDSGATWEYATPVSACCSSNFSDISHGWVTDGHLLYMTTDGGRRWRAIRPGPLFADVRQLDFVSPGVGWAVRETSPFLLKTVDGGHTWAPVTYTIVRQ